MAEHRFAVDRMLGRLATWLRLLGMDTTYGVHLWGRTLIRHGRAEARTVLTRDRHLLRMAPPPLLLIASDHFRNQLRQVIAAFPLDPFAHLFTRCARCNVPLTSISRMRVAHRIPPYVALTQDRFVTCPSCHRVYWSATHCQRVIDELRDMGFTPPDVAVT